MNNTAAHLNPLKKGVIPLAKRGNSTAPSHRLARGDVFAGRYEIRKVCATSMTNVFFAFDTVERRFAALKTTDDSALYPLFDAEAAVLSWQEPAFPTLYESGLHDHTRYVAMEWIDGKILSAVMAGKKMPLYAAIEITMQVLNGLRTLHDRNKVHCDVKPGNVMLAKAASHKGTSQKSYVKILDFGIVCEKGHQDSRIIGTPAYASPEQLRNQTIYPRVDIYGTGVMLFKMLTGQPFLDCNDWVTLAENFEKPAPRLPEEAIKGRFDISGGILSQLVDEAYQQLESIVAQMTAFDPEQRFQEVGTALVQLANLRKTADALKPFEPILNIL